MVDGWTPGPRARCHAHSLVGFGRGTQVHACAQTLDCVCEIECQLVPVSSSNDSVWLVSILLAKPCHCNISNILKHKNVLFSRSTIVLRCEQVSCRPQIQKDQTQSCYLPSSFTKTKTNLFNKRQAKHHCVVQSKRRQERTPHRPATMNYSMLLLATAAITLMLVFAPAKAACGYDTCSDKALYMCSLHQCTSRTIIDLHSKNLWGTIPSALGSLTQLTYALEVYINQLTGTLPPSLGSLSTMNHYLGFSSNALTGTIPPSYGSLTQLLHHMSFSINQVGVYAFFARSQDSREFPTVASRSMMEEVWNHSCQLTFTWHHTSMPETVIESLM